MDRRIWTRQPIGENETFRWKSPGLLLQLHREGRELEVSWLYGPQSDYLKGFEPYREGEDEDLPCWDAQRRFVMGKAEEIELVPLLPDRPVVLVPSIPRSIPSGRRCSFSFLLPVWFSLRLVSPEKRHLVLDMASEQMGQTWFGDLTSGELAYAYCAEIAQAETEGASPFLEHHPFRTEIRLHLANSSSQILDFKQICVHVEHLSLYTNGSSLFCNDLSVHFSGEDQISQVRFGKRMPKSVSSGGEGGEKLSGPRIPPEKNLFKRSFSFLRSLTEW